MFSTYSRGIYFALITAFVSGISIFVNKFAVGSISPPLVFTATKNFGVGLLILAIILSLGKWEKVKSLKKRELGYLILIGIIGGSVPFYLFFTGISQIPAINAALIHKTLVIWVALLAAVFLGERMTKLQIAGVVFLFGGNLIIGGFEGFLFSRGELFVLGATLLWAVENILAKKILPSVDPDLVTGARMGFGSIILLGAAVVTVPNSLGGIFNLSPTQVFWMTLTMFALLAYVMSWYRALKYAPATTVAAVLVSSTLVTNLLSALFTTHRWNISLIFQAGLIFSGLVLFWVSEKRKASVAKIY